MTTCPFCASSTPEDAISCPTCGATLAGLQLETGLVLIGKYTLEQVLGQGGFGITYLATDQSLNRKVAIKELFPEGCTRDGNTLIPATSLGLSGFAETKTRFLEEAQTLAQFNHLHIVRVFEVFEANSTAYIVMEALEGKTLGNILARDGTLPEIYVKRIATDVCDALEIVHQNGLLHRDIKPDNLFITTDNRVVLLDFGSARGFQTGKALRHTQLVSPGYAAPEQYASQAKFGTYTDVYGLSATLFHAATGKPPPTASDRVISSDADLHMPSHIAEPLRTALTRGLALRIDQRPQTAKDFVKLLEEKSFTPISKPFSQTIPNKQTETILFRNNDMLVTSKQIEIKQQDQYRTVSTYFISDLALAEVTNDQTKLPLKMIMGGEPGVWVVLLGLLCVAITFGILKDLSISLPVAAILISIGTYFYVKWFRNQKGTFYLHLVFKTNTQNAHIFHMPTELFLLPNAIPQEAEIVASRIRAYLEP